MNNLVNSEGAAKINIVLNTILIYTLNWDLIKTVIATTILCAVLTFNNILKITSKDDIQYEYHPWTIFHQNLYL